MGERRRVKRMAYRKIIQLHFLEKDEFEFFGSPASMFDVHTPAELLIDQKNLKYFFIRQKSKGLPMIYRNSCCEIRKGTMYVKPTSRGNNKER